ncbi:hypothetical protein B0A49_05346 [Cryomyces minteri]|uniref:Fatty acid hydroxylase domain-containing protein n=1 Tax=Cryomyces minteri TaxID=331657 RepID=A0A4V5NEX3_9PEZI|nr:hypothetical protein B0A49_05346 [Cryomyces minteri]
MSSFISLPLLSFLALPALTSPSTSLNILFFYVTWTTLVLSHSPLNVEVYGSLAIRAIFYILSSLLFLAFDTAFPSLAVGVKAQGESAIPSRAGKDKAARVVAVATFNVLLGVALQTGTELLFTEVFHVRSGIKVTASLPSPWGIAKDLLSAFAIRGVLHYAIHRYILHSESSFYLSRWHNTWQHSVRAPYAFVATYDHPICYVLSLWVPTYAPALLFRFHVLKYHLFTALVSLEEALVYSGYSVLPSTIVLSGMARRTDAHFTSKGSGNFGVWGLLDWLSGTTVAGGKDVIDDVGDEMEKHGVARRASDAIENGKGMVEDAKERLGGAEAGDRKSKRNERRQMRKESVPCIEEE